ncbi:hypothetical protein NOVOSPHI9U_440014 [Novosphingobium sp. 9U]|nr:hypothetical protein NOVOSPHI9U_440014 [Novosphingobium sp. 9U]
MTHIAAPEFQDRMVRRYYAMSAVSYWYDAVQTTAVRRVVNLMYGPGATRRTRKSLFQLCGGDPPSLGSSPFLYSMIQALTGRNDSMPKCPKDTSS